MKNTTKTKDQRLHGVPLFSITHMRMLLLMLPLRPSSSSNSSNVYTTGRCLSSISKIILMMALLLPGISVLAQPTWQVQSNYFGERNAIAQPRTIRGMALSHDGLSVYTGLIQSPNVGTTSIRKVRSEILAVAGTDHVIFGNGMPGGTGGFAPVGDNPVYAGGNTGTFQAWLNVGNSPEGIATDDRGYVYVALTSGIGNANRINIYDSTLSTHIGTVMTGGNPRGVRIHKTGSTYYAYTASTNGLERYNVTNVGSVTKDNNYNPNISGLTNIAIDLDGTVYVTGNNQVRRISSAGTLTHTSATITNAQGIAVYYNKLYVIKTGSPSQSITVLNKADLSSAGADLSVPDFGITRSNTVAQFRAIDVNAKGNLYISEENYNGTQNSTCSGGGCITSYTPPATSFNQNPKEITGRIYFDRVVQSSPVEPNYADIQVTVTDATCSTLGSVSVSYNDWFSEYSIDGVNYTTAPASPFTLNNLSPGNYTVYIKDGLGNISTAPYSVLAACPDKVFYVSPTKTPTWQFGVGGTVNGVTPTGDGSLANPFATIQEAYAAAWGVNGDHQIRLLPGTYEDDHIGRRGPNNNLSGTMQFHSGPFANNAGWKSMTLVAHNGPGTVHIIYKYTLTCGSGTCTQPTAYEKILTAGNHTTPFGLFQPSGQYSMPNMRVQDLKITVQGGGVLIGRVWDNHVVNYTFTNVDLYLETNETHGNAAILWHDGGGVTSSSIKFVNSNIYYEPGSSNTLFAGQSWWGGGASCGTNAFPKDLITGDNSSRIYFWNGSTYSIKNDLSTGIWESRRNIPNTTTNPCGGGTGGAGRFLKWNENGSNADGNEFLSEFLTTPPSTPDFVTIWNTDGITSLQFELGNNNVPTPYYWEEVGNASNNGTGTFSATNSNWFTITGLPNSSGAKIRLAISPQITQFRVSHTQNRLLEVAQWGDAQWRANGLEGAFNSCSEMNVTATDAPNLSNVTSLSRIFVGCRKLVGSNLGDWNVSTVQNMTSVFHGCHLFNSNITSWNTSNVTSMFRMFFDAKTFNQNISSWNVGKVTNMNDMFNTAEFFNQDLSSWCVENIATKPSGFDNNTWRWNKTNRQPVWGASCSAIPDPDPDPEDEDPIVPSVPAQAFVTIWNTDGITSLQFELGNNNVPTPYYWEEVGNASNNGADTFSATNSNWFTITGLPNSSGAKIRLAISPQITQFRVSHTQNRLLEVAQWGDAQWRANGLVGAFNSCSEMNVTATDTPNLSNVTSLSQIFVGCRKLVGSNLGDWNVSTVQNMTSVFHGCHLFNSNITSWNTSNVTSMFRMFFDAKTFNQNISSWNVGKVTNMNDLFNTAEFFNQDLSSWCVDNIAAKPSGFDNNTWRWNKTNRQPVWGTCPPPPQAFRDFMEDDIAKDDKLNIVVYPNPSNGTINVKVSDKNSYAYRLIDMQGKMIRNGIINGTNTIDNLAAGMYKLIIVSNAEQHVTSIIVH
jgi:surface protein